MFKCIKEFTLPVQDTGEEMAVEVDTLWERDDTENYIGGEIHLENPETLDWVEITTKDFEQHFVDMRKMDNLRECPLCGKGVAELATCHELEDCTSFEACGDSGWYSAVCNVNNGGCGASGGYADSEGKAIEKWNRRPEPANEHIPENPDSDGLKVKYNVTKVSDGSAVYDCFVLRPDKDPAAVVALRAYATATVNKQLAADILGWVGEPANEPLTPEQLRERVGKGDHIRSMTDEELAAWMVRMSEGDQNIKFCVSLQECNDDLSADRDIPQERCVGCMLHWLQQPAEPTP